MSNKNEKDSNNYYNQRASEYEQIYYYDIPERRKEIDDEVARLKTLVKNKSVLELACGTGYWTTRISETARQIITSDISEQMITEAQKKEYHCSTHFVRSDLSNPPFAKESFDIIVLGFWFSHEPKQSYDSLIKSLQSLIKPDGQIWMIDNNPPAEGSQFKSKGSDEHGNNYKLRFLDNGSEFVVLKNYFTENSLKEIFSPYFNLKSIIFKKYYWSIVLENKKQQRDI